jgi:hypothetical protein
MQETVASPPRVKRQKIGRRLGPEPYYELGEPAGGRLTLNSRPALNQPVARNFLLLSVALGLPALALLGGGIILVGVIGLPAMLLVILGLLLGTAALIANTTGRALRRIRNQIVVDPAQGTLVYRQYLDGRPARLQTLPLEHVAAIMIAPREVKLFPAFLGRTRTLQILEMRAVDGYAWHVDSADRAEALAPTAEALSAALGLPVER